MALGELQTTLARAGKQKQAAAAAFAAASAAVLLHLPMPEEMPPVGDFLPLLPPGLRTFALYVQAHYLYPKEEYALSAGMVEGDTGHGREVLPHSGDLSASGGGYGLHEPETDPAGAGSSAGRLGRSGIITSTSGLCEHHTEHTADCGYTEGTAEIPCSHEHNESCGGLIAPDTCNHTHKVNDGEADREGGLGRDEACGYAPATEGTPCTYVCEICNAQDSGNPVTPSDAQPEECTCETLCTEEEINEDCPVCSAEGAELDKVCVGAAPMLPVTVLSAGERDSHSNNWMELTAGTTLSGGSYYLSGDVEYSGTEITVNGEVILCFNGHKLNLNKQHISVGSGASPPLCDCSTGGSGSNGGGVCLYGTFYLSGDSIIQNNTKAGATGNLYLGWNTIKITGPPGENARIGVTAEGVPRSFISG